MNANRTIKKTLLILAGLIGVGLGAAGSLIPLLPTFPFLLLAAACFAKSSERLDRWFKGTRLYKSNLESFAKGQGMTRGAKIRVMLTVTVVMSIGFILMDAVPVGRAVLICIWILHVLYFTLIVKSRQSDSNSE